MGVGMNAVDLIAGLGTVAFFGLLVGTSMLAGAGFGPEKRARLLERRDPGTAAALRRGESFTQFSSTGGEVFGPVCTPTRRSWYDMARVRATDSDLRVEAVEEALPPMPATVMALAGSEHVAQTPRPRHPHRSTQPAGGAKNSGHQPTASG